MTEQFSNKATTTLNGAINNSVTSLVVTSATGFPTNATFRIVVDPDTATEEIMTVTAISGTTYTITRATEAIAGIQTAFSHADGAVIKHVLTAGALKDFALPAGFIGCKAVWASGAVPGGGGYQPIGLNGVDVFDTDNFHNPASNNSRMTIPAGLHGYYFVTGSFYSGTSETVYTIIKKNGSPAHSDYGVSGDDTIETTINVLYLNGGDYVELGVNATTLNTVNAASLTIYKLDSGRVGTGIGVARTDSTEQTISAGVEFTVTHDTLEYDTNGFYTGSGIYTIPTGLGGRYFISARVYMDGTVASSYAYIQKNGTGEVTGTSSGAPGPSAHLQPTAIIDLAAGENIRIRAYRSSGTKTGWATSQSSNRIQIVRIDSSSSAFIHTTLGTTSIGASWQGTRAVYLKQITLTKASLIPAIVAYIKGNGSNKQGISVAIQEDIAGTPGNIIAFNGTGLISDDSAYATQLILSSTGRWMRMPIGAWLDIGTYWLAVRMYGGAGDLIFLAYTSGGSDRENTSAMTNWTDESTDASSTGSNNYSIYVDIIN